MDSASLILTIFLWAHQLYQSTILNHFNPLALNHLLQLKTSSSFFNILRFDSRQVVISISTSWYSYDNEVWWMEVSHVEDKEGPFCSATACPACLFTNQSITLCFPFVINQASPAPFPSPPLLQEEKTEDSWNINQTEEKWQWWNEPGGMMPLLSTNGTIVPGPVNCNPGQLRGHSGLSARLYLLDETGAHYADIQDHIWQIYDFGTKKTKANALDFMPFLNKQDVTCRSNAI